MKDAHNRRPTFPRWLLSLLGLAVACQLSAASTAAEVDVVIVVGAGGTEHYAEQFAEWAERWQATAESAGAKTVRIGPHAEDAPEPEAPAPEDRQRMTETVERLKAIATDSPLWLVLIGHGTYQQGTANFNMRGPDISAARLADVVAGATRPLVIINSASASGPFIDALSGENRIIVTATRAGDEQNFARFGDYLSRTIGDLQADLDHDESISILEAYLAAAGETRQFYEREGRLATEHALIDDNGDNRGTPADFFRGVRVVGQAEGDAEPDGRLANRVRLRATPADLALNADQRERVTAIEQAVYELRNRKSEMETDAYFEKLEELMVELAQLYDKASQSEEP